MRILPLTAAHLEAAIWNSAEEYEREIARLFWHLHTPYAQSWCAEVHDEVAGFGTAVRFGDSARITVCKVEHGRDPVPIRAALVSEMLAQAQRQGCSSTTVTVAPDDVPHWTALHFVPQEEVLRYDGGKFYEGTYPDVMWLEPQHRMAVMHLDRQASGEDRSVLLLEHEYLGRVYLDGIKVRGFALALLGHALIVADTPTVGLELQRWILPTQEHLLVPAGNAAAHEHLVERGYTPRVVGVRMVHGEPRSTRTSLLFGEPYGPLGT
ncbi:MAG: hypothetical protein IPL52_08675 [Flavobacteriales bacterium]|nr:hypothetical protein [Flavobacteriales bacterium]